MMYDILIVGGGPAGLSAAVNAAARGKRCAVLSNDYRMNPLDVYKRQVYNFIHIGNARPLCVFDVLRRYLEWRGYEVRFVQNFTDIDAKIIRRANEEGVSYDVIAQRYIEEFRCV